MGEKRFTVISEKIGRFHNIFVQTDKIEYLLTGDFDNDSEMIKEIVDLLNEQQATIRKLQDLCGESDYENAKLRLKNKELQDKIDLLCEKYDYPKQELSETHYESKINY